MREINTSIANDLNQIISIEADERDESGASHFYTMTAKEEGKPWWLMGQITFQKGGIKGNGVNGITNEALLSIVIDRLDGFMSGAFPSRETAIAKTKLQEALMWLESRTKDRIGRGVEGENVA